MDHVVSILVHHASAIKSTLSSTTQVSGNTILEFDLLPSEAKNPDVIIHAYATNDMHLSTLNEVDHEQYKEKDSSGNNNNYYRLPNGSWREKVMTVLQEFIRLTQTPPSAPCPTQSSSRSTSGIVQEPTETVYPPMVLHLDDYLGNEQREILATTELSQAVHILANYYGTLTAISYSDIVRDWVYGDTHEFWFSPSGWYPPYKLDKSKMKREIHPGMPMHMVVPWIISYALLTLWTHYCDTHPYHHLYSQQSSSMDPSKRIYDHEYDMARLQHGLPLPALKGNVRFPGKPHVTPIGLPPPLHPSLSLLEVSNLWRNQSDARMQDAKSLSPSCVSPEHPKCPFAWVSGLLKDHNALDEAAVEAYFRTKSAEFYNHGWEVRRHTDGKKMGLVPVLDQPGANLTLFFEGAPSGNRIQQIVVFYLKSYGERWKHSRLRIKLDHEEHGTSLTPILVRDVVGFHAKNTSELYVERISLPRIIEERIRVELTLASGKAFKIMGMLVCL